MLLCFTACPPIDEDSFKKSNIIGKWSGETRIISVIMVETEINFYENGKGYITPKLDVGISFDYSINNNVITIIPDTPIIKKTMVYEFELDEDKLVLFDSDGEMEFTRVE